MRSSRVESPEAFLTPNEEAGMGSVLRFHRVTFGYVESPRVLFEDLTLQLHTGWSGIIGSNGAGKTTLLELATGWLTPSSGDVDMPGHSIYCAQRTDDPPLGFGDFLESSSGEAWELRGRLGVEADWLDRWQTLSHGERKRAQLGVALWREPSLLAVDEPTNHLDREAAGLLVSALERFRGVGLIVSHDRALLDRFCKRCVFLGDRAPVLRSGGYSRGAAQAALENETALETLDQARKERKRLEAEAARRRDLAARSHQMRSKRGIARKDHDAKAKKDLARMSGKDGQAGRLLDQMSGRVDQAQQIEESIDVVRPRALGIWIPGHRSRRSALCTLEPGSLRHGEPGAPREAEGWSMMHPALVLKPADRVGLVGPNGAGKSTLIEHMLAAIELPEDRLVYVPQEIDRERSSEILREVHALDRAQLGATLAVVSHLGSDPGRLLDSALPSPGEVRKLMLARGVAQHPHLIVMDEPTNHLDLPSIECLEAALSECPCALLLVSHDERFLERVTTLRWEIQRDCEETFRLHVEST